MATPPDEPPDDEEWLKALADRVRPPDTPMVMQPGEAELVRPLPTIDTKQQGFTEAREHLLKDGVIQTPDQKVSAEELPTLERLFGDGQKEPAPDDTPPEPSNNPKLTPGY